MRITPALEYEKLRQDPASWRKIILHRDGKFYHAYQWSAWLIKQYVCTEELQKQRGDDKMLQANRYTSKSGEYVMLGFPVDSLSKYIPAYTEAHKMADSDDMEITVAADFGDATYETLQQAVGKWQAECPVKDRKAKSNAAVMHSDGAAPAMARSGLFSIVSRVLAYPVEAKTPAENIEFISQLRQDVAALLL